LAIAECHPNRKVEARGLCKPCYDRWLKSNNPEYRKRQISNTTQWFKVKPEKRKEYAQRRRDKIEKDPTYAEQQKRSKRNSMLKAKYGITLKEYEALLVVQDYGCAICHRKEGTRPLHVDHDHGTGKVRGLLCHQCNWYLGTIESGPNILSNFLSYIDKHHIGGK
jgi:hypothetical protein